MHETAVFKMPNPKSVFRKYVSEKDGKNECHFCKKTFSKNITRSFSSRRLWEDADVDVVKWWKEISSTYARYKEISILAIRILTIPPSSACVERMFSKHQRIHRQDRNRLKNCKVDKLVTVQAFYQSKFRTDDWRIRFWHRCTRNGIKWNLNFELNVY